MVVLGGWLDSVILEVLSNLLSYDIMICFLKSLTQIFKNWTALQKSTGGKFYMFPSYVSEQSETQLKNRLIPYCLWEKFSEALQGILLGQISFIVSGRAHFL